MGKGFSRGAMQLRGDDWEDRRIYWRPILLEGLDGILQTSPLFDTSAVERRYKQVLNRYKQEKYKDLCIYQFRAQLIGEVALQLTREELPSEAIKLVSSPDLSLPEREEILRKMLALTEYPGDTSRVRHALAELYFNSGRPPEALSLIQEDIQEPGLSESRRALAERKAEFLAEAPGPSRPEEELVPPDIREAVDDHRDDRWDDFIRFGAGHPKGHRSGIMQGVGYCLAMARAGMADQALSLLERMEGELPEESAPDPGQVSQSLRDRIRHARHDVLQSAGRADQVTQSPEASYQLRFSTLDHVAEHISDLGYPAESSAMRDAADKLAYAEMMDYDDSYLFTGCKTGYILRLLSRNKFDEAHTCAVTPHTLDSTPSRDRRLLVLTEASKFNPHRFVPLLRDLLQQERFERSITDSDSLLPATGLARTYKEATDLLEQHSDL